MKKFIVFLACVLSFVMAFGQVPYFSSTPGDANLYGYTSVKFRPGINAQETYTCFQYGLGKEFAVGTDLSTGAGAANWGFLGRFGKVFSPYFGLGLQVTPSFALNDNFKFSHVTGAMYLNGNIGSDGHLCWVSNTWFELNRHGDTSITNWEYIGYSFILSKGSITPMVGMAHDWKFKQDPDMAAGAYYSLGRWNFYVWGNDFFKNHPRIVFGIDFKFYTKG